MARAKKQTTKTQEQIDKADLIEYFASISSTKINYASTNSILKRMMESGRGYTYKGLKYALWYAHEHNHVEITSISIAEYVYDEAREYFEWKKKMKKQIAQWERNEQDVLIEKSKDRREDVFV